MKIATMIVRILMGLMFLFASVTYFLKLFPTPELTGNVKLFMTGVEATVYLMPLVKATELTCGLAFLIGRFVPLATVVITPVVLNIVLYHAFIDPANIPIPIALLLGTIFLAYVNRKHYESVLVSK